MRRSRNWFEVDKDGLASILARYGRGRAVLELISNAWDEPGVSIVSIDLQRITASPFVRVTVTDDAPDGFTNLRDAFTLFAPSKKKSDAETRGRFNLGEKLVLALCRVATIESTTGTIVFDEDGRRSKNYRRPKGSRFLGEFRATAEEFDDIVSEIRSLIPPADIETKLTLGDPLKWWTLSSVEPDCSAYATLATEVEGAEGDLRASRRKTSVDLSRKNGRPGWLYELGIPVVEIGGPYSVDVGQKIPLTLDRTNVRPAFLRELRAAVLNRTATLLSKEEVSEEWVEDALAQPTIESYAVEKVFASRYGKNAVAADPSDPEGTKLAASKGFAVIHGRSHSKAVWANVRKAEVLRPAGQVTPSKKVEFSLDGKDIEISRRDYTPGQRLVTDALKQIAEALLGQGVSVSLVAARGTTANEFQAWFGGRTLTLNYDRLGAGFFNVPGRGALFVQHLSLLLHELAHYYESDHLSERYHEAAFDLGARLAVLVATDPKIRKLIAS